MSRVGLLAAVAALALVVGGCTPAPPSTTTAPGIPTNLFVAQCAGGTQAISWGAPTSDGGSPITTYQVVRDGAAPVGVGLSTMAAFPCGDNNSLYSIIACNAVGCGAPTLATGYVPPVAVAGNGIVEPGEGCDDGNTVNGDGCSATATVEVGFVCTGSPSVCVSSVAVAGNGIVEPGEGCDDGNTVNGDGCSATATVEPGYVCTGSPSVCVPTMGVLRAKSTAQR